MTQAHVFIMSLSVSAHSPGSLHLTSSSTQQIHITIDGFYVQSSILLGSMLARLFLLFWRTLFLSQLR